MTRKRRTSTSLPRTALGFLGLTAVIIGILALHVWMGGHSSTHRAATSAATSATTSATTGVGVHVHAAGHMPEVVAVMVAADAGHHLSGCASDCADEMVGMCVLALIVVGLAAIRPPGGQGLVHALSRRGPPVAPWRSRHVPGPSPTRLCISRT